jgi:hypothetical protein
MEVSTHEWPIVSIKTTSKKINSIMYESFKKNLLECLQLCSDKNQQCMLIIDISTISFDPQTIMYAAKMNTFRNKIIKITNKYVQDLYIVVKNRHIRNVFKLFTLHELKNKYYYIVKSPEKVKRKISNNFNITCDNDEIINDKTNSECLNNFKAVANELLAT